MATSPLLRRSRGANDADSSVGATDDAVSGVLRWAAPILPGLVALAFGLWRLTGAGLWRDEAATVSSSRRSLSQLWGMTAHVDAMHGVYYMLIHLDFALFGSSALALRLPSALAGAAAAALVAVVGSRLANPRAGLLAGLFWAVLPQVSRYLQEGRSYALVSLFVIAAAYFLVRRKWIAFAVTAAFVSALNLLSVLSLVAFTVTLLLWRAQGAADNRALRRASAAIPAAVLVGALPVALRGRGQNGVLNWIPRPNSRTLTDLATAMSGSHRMMIPVLLIAAFGCGHAFLRNERRLAALALPLAVLPPALLIGYSLVGRPMYVLRYVLYALIGVAWLVGLGLDALLGLAGRLLRLAGRPLGLADGPLGLADGPLGRLGAALGAPLSLAVGALMIATVAAQGWTAQTQIRTIDGHGDPLLQMAQVVRDNARPGDGVLFLPTDRRYVELAYPSYFRDTADLLLAKSPGQADDLYGKDYPLAELPSHLQGHDRVWVVWSRGKQNGYQTEGFARLRAEGYHVSRSWQILPSRLVVLFVKSH